MKQDAMQLHEALKQDGMELHEAGCQTISEESVRMLKTFDAIQYSYGSSHHHTVALPVSPSSCCSSADGISRMYDVH